MKSNLTKKTFASKASTLVSSAKKSRKDDIESGVSSKVS